MHWALVLLIGIFIGGALGFLICSLLFAAGSDAARYSDGGKVS